MFLAVEPQTPGVYIYLHPQGIFKPSEPCICARKIALYDPDDAERLEREQAPFRPFPPLWIRFLRVVGAALLVVLIQADWTQRKLRDYFLRPLARITNRVSPRGYQTYDWEE